MADTFPVPEDSSDAATARGLMATLTHELRTPLNGIIGTASLLADTPLGPHQAEYVTTIRKSAARLLDMLNNVLDFARLETQPTRFSPNWMDPAALARDVCELLAPRAHEKALDLAVAVWPDAPVEAFADSEALRQILFNLTGNAIKFTDTGSVLIEIMRASPDAGGLALRVSDTGPGVPLEHQLRIFEAFAQVDSQGTPRDGGVGLGLAIVKRLVTDLEGSLDICSEHGHGARFEVTFPRMRTRATSAKPGSSNLETDAIVGLAGLPAATTLALALELHRLGLRPEILSEGVLPAMPVSGVLADARISRAWLGDLIARNDVLIVLRPEDRAMIPDFRKRGCVGYLVRPVRPVTLSSQLGRSMEHGVTVPEDERVAMRSRQSGQVLVADDNGVNALIAQRALEKAGFTVTVVRNGADAVECALQQPFDLVLMDLRMPLVDGFEAMQRIRACGGGDVPIVAISAEIDPIIERRARECGADAVATKPLDAATLIGIVQHWSKRGRAAA